MNYSTTLKSDKAVISPRESEVLKLIAFEHSSKQIARELSLSVETINSHRKNLMRKLDVANTAGLVRRSFEMGILQLKSFN